jgi:hypothetical protein
MCATLELNGPPFQNNVKHITCFTSFWQTHLLKNVENCSDTPPRPPAGAPVATDFRVPLVAQNNVAKDFESPLWQCIKSLRIVEYPSGGPNRGHIFVHDWQLFLKDSCCDMRTCGSSCHITNPSKTIANHAQSCVLGLVLLRGTRQSLATLCTATRGTRNP